MVMGKPANAAGLWQLASIYANSAGVMLTAAAQAEAAAERSMTTARHGGGGGSSGDKLPAEVLAAEQRALRALDAAVALFRTYANELEEAAAGADRRRKGGGGLLAARVELARCIAVRAEVGAAIRDRTERAARGGGGGGGGGGSGIN
jgi:hypothetical protein